MDRNEELNFFAGSGGRGEGRVWGGGVRVDQNE